MRFFFVCSGASAQGLLPLTVNELGALGVGAIQTQVKVQFVGSVRKEITLEASGELRAGHWQASCPWRPQQHS